MFRFGLIAIAAASALQSASIASAREVSQGTVLEHAGEPGELIVSRDGVIYWLSTGDELFSDDVLRAQKADTSTITFNGCVITLEAKVDTVLDDQACTALILSDTTTMAETAAESGSAVGPFDGAINAGAPLTVGGIILSAGGLAAATDGGSGGTASATSNAAGAPTATVDP